MPTSKRFSSLWLFVLLFLSATAAVPALCPRPRPLPDSPQELARLLSEKLPDLHVVPDSGHGRILNGFYLTTDPNKSYADLAAMPRRQERIDCWTGSVHCARQDAETAHHELFSNHYLVAPPYLFFGDSAILEKIAAQLPGG
jgi:hypothetical protein